MIENQSLMSFGRFDQHLEPFFAKYPPDQAQELLECLLIKLNDQADIKQGEGYYGSDNLMLAGIKPDDSDATNGLTFACLDALETLRLANPQFNVRLHHASPPELVARVCDLARRGCAQLSFYNDEAIIPSLAHAGFPIEDARNYALDACQDILIEGRSDFFVGGGIELTPLLLDALQGVDEQTSFEQLMDACRSRVRDAAASAAERYLRDLEGPSPSPLPFLSGTLDDCIDQGLDVTQGGLRYRDKGMFVMSPVNAVNSLTAIQHVVFRDRAASLVEVRDACVRNYEGQEPLRQRLLAAPKWGNDDDRVDELAKDLLEFACKEILQHRIDPEARFLAGIHQPHHVTTGARIGATPDGRMAGEPICVTLSPANGTERRGPTAVLKSVAKIDPMLCQWNSAVTLNLHPTAVAGESAVYKLEALLRTFFALGGIQLQTNILDSQVFREAQCHPDRYRDLVIRVWGFSAYFVDLSPAYQEEFIARTAHRL
jgi:formate C-acetyltransferase